MRTLFILFILFFNVTYVYALKWETCLKKYEKAKQFDDNVRLSYIYLKSTKNCLVKFRDSLIKKPNPDFTVKAMNENILMIDKYINNLIFQYSSANNDLEEIPKYIDTNSDTPVINQDYNYLKRFNHCNGVHASDKIYTARHCNIDNSINLQFDLSYIPTKDISKLKVTKLDITKKGKFKYYSMSKEGMFYNILLEEKNCKFYMAKNIPIGFNTTLDYTDLSKKEEVRSNCLAIPSNSGGGVFQDGKLVGIISKTVFNENKFLYSVVEPIIPFH